MLLALAMSVAAHAGIIAETAVDRRCSQPRPAASGFSEFLAIFAAFVAGVLVCAALAYPRAMSRHAAPHNCDASRTGSHSKLPTRPEKP